ncbi:Sas10/Utp3/C1D [Lasallia pustulata]|uniref:Sas10/Utp3/C1D n=1 Tax=Lasallia pustulata TaxID=136370 RepID=A0A1W5D6C0_9LECA|nr:Sas10/Utp3/C1D [Lasallia pustulata]
MGKKRKAGGKPFGQAGPRELDEADAKLRINTYEDVADSEDEFHINRDKILLSEDLQQRKQAFLELSDEEVLADALSLSESDDDDDESVDLGNSTASGPKGARKPLGLEESDQSGEEEDELGDWGTSKRDYYNADTIETEADALEEEAEARRLQQKRLQGLTELDFGVIGDKAWLDSGKHDREGDGIGRGHVIQEVLPQLEITDAMGPDERMKIMKSRYPEFEPLAAEFLELQSLHEDLKLAAAAADAVQHRETSTNHFVVGRTRRQLTKGKIPTAIIKHSALTAYLASLSMYFALLTSPADGPDGKALTMSPAELRNHPVMESLMKCRELWDKVKDLRIPDLSEPSPILGGLNNIKAENQQDAAIAKPMEREGDVELVAVKRRKSRKSKAQRAAESAQLGANARRAECLRKTEEELAVLTTLTRGITRKPARTPPTIDKPSVNDEDTSDFGEQTTLTAHEAAEKAKRKKSLRFYTSQIAQKANKRGAAGRDAGGDADLPYRERLRDRVIRLNSEAEARGKKPKESPGDQLGGESDEEDGRAVRELREEGNASEDDYYDMVAASSKKKKADKKALAEAQLQAAKEGGTVQVVEEVGPDGKRAISYAIEKNKGLAPKRKKDVRNPRVKKRKKFEEKKKKLGSMKAVYKGGEGRGGYGGELTGIKKGLVKSIKL